MGDEGVPVDLDAVVERVRRRVEERRAAGDYPEELTEALDAQFRQLLAQRGVLEWPAEAVEAALAGVGEAGRFDPGRIELGGPAAKRKVHEVAGLLVTRQVHGILHQAREFADAVRAALDAQWQALRSLEQRQSLLDQRLEMVLDKLARHERGDGPPEVVVEEPRRRGDDAGR